MQLSDAAQNAAYFVVAEALTNVEKHSRARHASVELRRVGALALINITDDGIGGASPAKGHGLSGLADRLAGVDGTLTVLSSGWAHAADSDDSSAALGLGPIAQAPGVTAWCLCVWWWPMTPCYSGRVWFGC